MMFGALTIVPVLAIGLLFLVSLLFIAGMLQKDPKPTEVSIGVSVVLTQTIGALLMSVAGLPTLYSVLMRQGLSMGTYTSLLFTFAVGGVLYLVAEKQMKNAGTAAQVPLSIMHTLWKMTGLLALLAGLLSLSSQVLIVGAETALWALPMHGTLLIYGAVLLWCTKPHPKKKKSWFTWEKKKKK